MHFSFRTLVTGLSYVLLCSTTHAQTDHLAAPSSTLIKQDVNEVTLDVVVRDKHRHFVRDLTAGDVQITDDGKPIVLKSFRLTSRDAKATQLRTVTVLLDRSEPQTSRAAYEAIALLVRDLAGSNTYLSAWRIENRLIRISDFTADVPQFQESLRTALLPVKQPAQARTPETVPAALSGVLLEAPAKGARDRGTNTCSRLACESFGAG